jgi:Protein of unknown function (DUF3040)
MEVAVMSLSTREQQVLDSIENRLAGSDPRLAALLATFARLTSGEPMPAREEIRMQARLVFGRARRLLVAFTGLNHVLALLWMLVAVGLIALAVVVSGGGSGGPCVRPWLVACTAPAPAHPVRAALPATS